MSIESRENNFAPGQETSQSLRYFSVEIDTDDPVIQAARLSYELADYGFKRSELLRSPKFHGKGIPHGHGQKVLEIPGMAALSLTLNHISEFLDACEYRTDYVLNPLEPNTKPVREIAERTIDKAWHEALSDQQVILIGHSLGGYDVLAVAALYPEEAKECIERIVLLGSPIAQVVKVHPAAAMIHSLTSARENDQLLDEIQTDFDLFESNGELTFKGIKVTVVLGEFDQIIRPSGWEIPGQTRLPTSHLGMIEDQYVYSFLGSELARDDKTHQEAA